MYLKDAKKTDPRGGESWGQSGKSGNSNNLPREHAEVRKSQCKWTSHVTCEKAHVVQEQILLGYTASDCILSKISINKRHEYYFSFSRVTRLMNSPTVTNTKLDKHIWPDQVLHAGRTQATKWQFKYRSSTVNFYFIVLNLIWAKTDVAVTIIYRP